jgi:DNA polymerase III subunit chi
MSLVMKVEFHTGVADKLGAACRFLRKAQAGGAAVVVCAERGTLDRLDSLLWTFDPLSFVAHVRLRGDATPSPALARTPTWLADDPARVPARDLLLNLGLAMVPGWEDFSRVVELVSDEAADADAGRERWRRYRAQPGLDLQHNPKGTS